MVDDKVQGDSRHPEASAASGTVVHEVVVIGAGIAGIGAAVRLLASGIDFVVLEKDREIGGVWRDNHYPDCGCDVPSALYSYSFAPNPAWSRMFAKQAEIRQYTEDTARRFGVMPHVRLNTELVRATWEDDRKCWRLETSAGSYAARFVVMACGPMHVPVIPAIKGLDTFAGPRFHSARWDHTCELGKQRIAVIGSGASAVQFVPEIQARAARLTLFQRTAPWVLPKMDFLIPARWQAIFQRHAWVQSLFRWAIYLQFEALNSSLKFPALARRLQHIGMKNIHRGIQSKGAQLKARVTPDYSIGCKRILLSNRWYRTLDKPNVELVGGIAEVQGNTLVSSDGTRCEVDVIIFATGFEVADPPIAQRIVGKSGMLLSTTWRGSPDAYLGTMTRDCPNLFLTFGPNLYTFSSAFVILEAQLKFIVSALTAARKNGVATIAVQPERLARYNLSVQSALQRSVWNSGCSSYFIDKNGRNSTNWPWTTFAMRRRLAQFEPGDYMIEPTAGASGTPCIRAGAIATVRVE